MSMRAAALLVALVVASATRSVGPMAGPQDASRPPNILLVVIDDARWDALGVAGNRIVQTPRLDAIAKDGVWFDQARVTTSICMVSRASLLTGQVHVAARHLRVRPGDSAGGVRRARSRRSSGQPATGRATSANTASARPARRTSTSCAPTKAPIG